MIHGYLLVMLPALCAPQGTAQDLSAQFELDARLEARLWAESPQLFNPTAIDVDARGRIWVAEAVNYRQWNGRNPGKHFDEGDRIVILEDKDGDGFAESSKVFAQEKGLVSPLGICVIDNRVLVSCSPNAILYTDTDGDDVPDKREVFLSGFGGPNHDHGLHSFVVGPDGEWYFNTGNAGPHLVQDASGWNLRSGSLYRDGGELAADNRPGLVSDDNRVYVGGLALRVGSNGSPLRVLAHNFRNNYELALDSYGNCFQSDNDDDGNQGCRTMWVMEGGNYGYFSADGSRYWNSDRRPGQSVPSAHWHQEDPGVLPAGCINGAGGPTGVAVYENGLLPADFNGLVLNCDAGRNVVYAHRPKANGAGWDMQSGALIAARMGTGNERERWFRPSDVCVGTDGAVYVADWYDPGVGGHAAGDREAYGRILRVAPKGDRTRAPALNTATLEGALAALASPAVQVRGQARARIVREGAAALEPLRRWMEGKDPVLTARGIWIAAVLSPEGLAAALQYLKSSDPNLRITALRAWRHVYELSRRTQTDPPARLFEDPNQLSEQHPMVLRELALAMRWNIDKSGRWRAFHGLDVRKLLDRWDGRDPWMLEALAQAYNELPEMFYTQRSTEEKDPLRWTDRTARLAWRIRPPELVPEFLARAMSAELSKEQRNLAIESLAFLKIRAAAEAMLTIALGGPEDLRPLARWWVQQRSTNDWADYNLAEQLKPRGGGDATRVWSSGRLREGVKAFDIDVRGAVRTHLVALPGGSNSCDWVDWLDLGVLDENGKALPFSLGGHEAASTEWGSVQVGKNCNGGPLRVGEQRYTNGVGTHAESRIVYALPKGAARLVGLVGMDHGGTSQHNGDGVDFEILLERPVDKAAEKARMELLTRADADSKALEAAVRHFAASSEGGMLLVRMAQEQRLSAAARTLAATQIEQCPDLAVRALARAQFPAATQAPGSERKSAVLALQGDARNGQKLFFGERARCYSCHRFYERGGEIGPDLSAVALKYGRGELLESILNPSAAIAFGYDAWMVETTDGSLYTGFITSDNGKQLVLKDTTGRLEVIPAAEVETKTKQKLSVMPDNAAMGLSEQELADLLEFLRSNPRVPGRRLSEQALFNGQDFTGWTFHSDTKGAKLEEVFTIENGVLVCKGNPIGYLRTSEDYTNFELSLEWRHDPRFSPGNSGVLMRMHGADKVWPKSIEAQLQHRNAGDIWNIDEFPMQTEASRTEGRWTGKALPCNEKPLGEWNRYDITLDGGELRLYVNGELQNAAHWCEERPGKICLQSEGAVIQFRNIRIRKIERD